MTQTETNTQMRRALAAKVLDLVAQFDTWASENADWYIADKAVLTGKITRQMTGLQKSATLLDKTAHNAVMQK